MARRQARILQLILISLIILSVILLFSESLVSWANYGEGTKICGEVLKLYCVDKHDPAADPGCFIQRNQQTTADRLNFGCKNDGCFGFGENFGAFDSSVTCSNTTAPPFQQRDQLFTTYGTPHVFTSRNRMNRMSAICKRIECGALGGTAPYGNWFWVRGELLITIIFTIEFLLRLVVADSWFRYWKDPMNTFDVLAILPLYYEAILAAMEGNVYDLDLTILASAPNAIDMSIRSFKVRSIAMMQPLT